MRLSRWSWIGVILAGAAGCSGSSLQTADAATHDANDSGASSSACASPTPLIAGLCVLDPTGARATSPTGIDPIPVTLVDVSEGMPGAVCAGGGKNGIDPNAPTERVRLRTSTGQQWTVYLVGGAATSLLNGESLELAVAASVDPNGWVSQTFVLTRSSQLVLFAAAMNAVPGGVLVPSIPSANFTQLNDDGVACMEGIEVPCARRRHRAQMVFENDSGFMNPGETLVLGHLTTFLAMFDQTVDNGACDEPTTTVVLGYTG
jgi:hypothetical protein